MNKILLAIPLAIIFSCSGNRQKIEETKQVKESFKKYKISILEANGEEAIKWIDSNTVDYYENMLQIALKSDEEEVSNLGLLDRLMVLSLRHRVNHKKLKEMTGKTLFVYAVKNKMIGEESVKGIEIGRVGTKENRARTEIIANGKKATYFFYFTKENGIWKIDLTFIKTESEKALKELLNGLGMNENEYIFQTLESITGKKVNENIWKPMS